MSDDHHGDHQILDIRTVIDEAVGAPVIAQFHDLVIVPQLVPIAWAHAKIVAVRKPVIDAVLLQRIGEVIEFFKPLRIEL